MTGINRIGQKVRCIEPYLEDGWCPDIATPQFDGEYTVSGFEECFKEPGIHLMEFPDTTCKCLKMKLSWPIKCFRPIISDQVKNDQITEIIDKVTTPVKKEKEKV